MSAQRIGQKEYMIHQVPKNLNQADQGGQTDASGVRKLDEPISAGQGCSEEVVVFGAHPIEIRMSTPYIPIKSITSEEEEMIREIVEESFKKSE
jgi:hypothetical protein